MIRSAEEFEKKKAAAPVLEGPVYLVGIGGSGMSGLARVLRKMGLEVLGSDLVRSDVTRELSFLGVRISFDQSVGEIPSGTRAVVRTAAVGEKHPEVRAARRMGIPVYRYAEVLGFLMAEREGIGIAGTHGKTTTTAMLAHVLRIAGRDPSFVVGGNVPILGGSAHLGEGAAMVVEACEYDRSFHDLVPRQAILTNIEADHLDCYPGMPEIREAFRIYCDRVGPEGAVFVNGNCLNSRKVAEETRQRVITFGTSRDCDYRAVDIRRGNGAPSFYVETPLGRRGPFCLSVPGYHNVQNALAVIACATERDVAEVDVRRALFSFTGASRRFDIVSRGAATIVDDYAHHPTEIRATLQAARDRYGDARIWAIFQPHQHSRTRHLLEDFAEAFEVADRIIVSDIYACRDSKADRDSVKAIELVRELRTRGKWARQISSFERIVQFVDRRLRRGDVVLTMGAGDIHRVASGLAWVRE